MSSNMIAVSPVVAPTPLVDVELTTPTNAADTTAAAPPAATTTTTTSKTAISSIDYMGYQQRLQAAWPDRPNLVIEYRDLSFIRKLPVASHRIETIATRVANILNFKPPKMRDFPALNPISGMVQPGTMTLVLAPPGHGKSTFLKALSGRFSHGQDKNMQHGTVLYNGLTSDESLAKGLNINRMTAYVDQGDVHMPLLTVRETFQFALDNAVADVSKLHDPQIQELHAKKVDLVLELLGLKECENTIIGNEMLRGVSGGQKRRVTIGEMLITNARALFLDEITTGLDSAASFDILNAMRQWARMMQGSCVAALLQPTPECFALFDRLVLLRQGHVIYDGPVDRVQAYFESIGIPVPDDQDLADFITDFLNDPKSIYMRCLYRRARKTETSVSRAPHAAQGADGPALEPYKATAGAATADERKAASEDVDDVDGTITAAHTSNGTSTDVVLPLNAKLSSAGTERGSSFHRQPLKARSPSDFRKPGSAIIAPNSLPSAALPNNVVPLTTSGLVAAFKSSSYAADIAAELQRAEGDRAKLSSFSRATLHPFTVEQFSQWTSHPFLVHLRNNVNREAKNTSRNLSMVVPRLIKAVIISLVAGSLFYQLDPGQTNSRFGVCLFSLIYVSFANMVELPAASEGKLVVFKQVDAGFYPPITYSAATVTAHLPLAVVECLIFGTITYFMSGFDPNAGRWIFFLLVLLCADMAMSATYRFVAYMVRFQEVAEQMSGPITSISMIFAGFLIAYNNIPDYLVWVYWMSPFSWGLRSIAQNEFFSSRFDDGNTYIRQWGMQTDPAYKWSGVGYLLGVWLLFVLLGAAALTYKRFPLTIGTSRVLADEEEEEATNSKPEEQVKLGEPVKMDMLRRFASSYRAKDGSSALPFEPIDLAWRDIKYTVQVKDDHGKTVDRVLLSGINGYARAGTLTALMGSSGAGKTTLMDVIAGRKTAGKMEGEILINGFPTPPSVFQRVMGYVEQTDIHLPTQTVREAFRFSARLRLPREVSDEQMHAFVEEVIDILELGPLADRLIGNASMPSLSPGQLKRVTIGVELVSNPPLLFLDEPTSGLDSRAALIVMRVVKRIAQTGRAVVCTIHQPSAELFYMFDRLLLLRAGGVETFFGDLGEFGSSLIEYFESAPVKEDFRAKMPPRTNPASWMLEVIGAGTGAKLKAKGYTKADLPDYAAIYAASKQREENMEVLRQVCVPKPGAQPMSLATKYAAPLSVQLRYVVDRAFQYYWRNTRFVMARFYVMLFLSIVFGLLYLNTSKSSDSGVRSMIAIMFLTFGFPGVVIAASSLPVLTGQRAVFYREQSSIMYTPWAYVSALTLVEVPYTAMAAMLFHLPLYFMVGLSDDGNAFFKYYLVLLLSVLTMAYLGQFLIAALPSKLTATLVNSFFTTFIFLFAGVFILANVIPQGWKWVYYIDFLPKALIAGATSQFECHDDNPTSANCQYIDVSSGTTTTRMRVQDYVTTYLSTGFDMYWPYIGYLVLSMCVVRMLGALSIVYINHLKR